MNVEAFIYGFVAAYSMAVSAEVFFRLFRFSYSPEYAFLYLVFCVFMGLTLLGVFLRAGFWLYDALRNEK